MKIYIGTCGWLYPWNREGNFDWYLQNSGLNAVELNASFYRFPFSNVVKSWANKTDFSEIRWSIKISRYITHNYRFKDKAFHTWRKFEELFKPLDRFIDFYLFQLPPIVTSDYLETIEKFYRETKLEERFALEARNISFFEENILNIIKDIGLTFVSIDSPNFPRDIYKTSNTVYLRIHGRKLWYNHNYTEEEIEEIAHKLKITNPERAYIFFNNNHDMLENGRMMKNKLKIMLQ
jgi:uncharacterized protein YecE (DUF72 family)